MTDSQACGFAHRPALLIFNPDTDYAMASGSDFYNPPASVVALRKRLCDTPLLYSAPGDAILLSDSLDASSLEAMKNKAESHGVELIPYGCTIPDKERFATIFPWGWNAPLRRSLLKLGFSESLLPSRKEISEIRNIAHRRTTIAFNRILLESGHPALDRESVPSELFNKDEVGDFLRKHPDGWLKAPWSSAGRGVLACRSISEEKILQWAGGIIRRQGSLMAECNASPVLDFASEWWISSTGKASFIGLSLFSTDGKGHFKSIISNDAEEIMSTLAATSPRFSDSILRLQKDALERIVAPRYRGPLGIDMAVCADGSVRACIEINLRCTMGMAAIPVLRNLIDDYRMPTSSLK